MKLSIITINYNNCEGLRSTLESVRKQVDREFEYIVIDGASYDGSVGLIEDFNDIISCTVSEPDRGIYHAMNKGVLRAKGEYCLFLNSGDCLHDPEVVMSFNQLECDSDVISGIETLVKTDRTKVEVVGEKMPSSTISAELFISASIGHGCTFIKTELLRTNPYDETLRIVSDWKFFFEELIIKKASYTPWCRRINDFDMTGVSNTQRSAMMIEREHVLTSYIPAKVLEDYRRLLAGRTPLEKILRAERPDGRMHKILTTTANTVLFIGKILGK